MTADARVIRTAREVVELLVAGEYEQLENLTKSRRLSADELRSAVDDYGERLCLPPRHVFEEVDALELTGSIPAKWSVRIDLWSVREGRSDLSLEMTLAAADGDAMEVEIDNIHVL